MSGNMFQKFSQIMINELVRLLPLVDEKQLNKSKEDTVFFVHRNGTNKIFDVTKRHRFSRSNAGRVIMCDVTKGIFCKTLTSRSYLQVHNLTEQVTLAFHPFSIQPSTHSPETEFGIHFNGRIWTTVDKGT